MKMLYYIGLIFYYVVFSTLQAMESAHDQALLSNLLKDPGAFLRNLQALKEEVFEEAEKRKDAALNYLELSKHHPIFFLDECASPQGRCVLNRLLRPGYREILEKKIIELANPVLQDKKGLCVVDLGSGELYQSLVICGKILNNFPKASLQFHAIDLLYSTYVFHLGTNRSVANDRSPRLNTTSACFDYVEKIFRKGGLEGNAQYSKEILKQKMVKTFILTNILFKQFLSFLETNFPEARISFFVHDDSESFLEFLHQKDMEFPDIISAADINDVSETVESFELLCKECNIKKPCQNVLLNKYCLPLDNLQWGTGGSLTSYFFSDSGTKKVHEFIFL